MKRLLLGVTGLFAAFMWSRGNKDPREWPRQAPKEFAKLWDDLDDAFSAARRAGARQEKDFEEELRRAREARDR